LHLAGLARCEVPNSVLPRLAFTESAALTVFVLDVVLGPWWVYFIAMIYSAIVS